MKSELGKKFTRALLAAGVAFGLVVAAAGAANATGSPSSPPAGAVTVMPGFGPTCTWHFIRIKFVNTQGHAVRLAVNVDGNWFLNNDVGAHATEVFTYPAAPGGVSLLVQDVTDHKKLFSGDSPEFTCPPSTPPPPTHTPSPSRTTPPSHEATATTPTTASSLASHAPPPPKSTTTTSHTPAIVGVAVGLLLLLGLAFAYIARRRTR